jgi:hypothetical protein
MSLPSYSFGAEGVEYGRKAPFYVPSSGPLALPSDLEVKGNLRVDGTSTLVGAVSVGGPFSVGTGGVSTSGSLLTGSSTTPGGAIYGYDGASVLAPNFPRGLASQGSVVVNQGSVVVTQGATGGTPGLVVTNAGIGGNPVRTVSVFNDQASPGTLISMQNGADSGTVAYTGTQFQLSRPLTIPVQTGSSGNLTVGGALSGFNSVRSRALNVSDNVTDEVIFWSGETYLITGVITGAGPSFTVFFSLPADIATNSLYRGMTIFNSDISIPSATRTVIFAIKDSAGTTLLTTTLSSLSQWEVNAKLGAPGNTNNPLGLFLTTNASSNMVAI